MQISGLQVRIVVLLVGLTACETPADPWALYTSHADSARAAELQREMICAQPRSLALRAAPVRVLRVARADFSARCESAFGRCPEDDPRLHALTLRGDIFLFEDADERTFAHEVAHTLQQGWPRGEVEDDASRVRSALREGHANYSAKLLRGELDEWRWFAPPADPPIDKAHHPLDLAPALGTWLFHWLVFHDRLDTLKMDEPPTSTSALLHPDRWPYAAPPSVCPDGQRWGELWIVRTLSRQIGLAGARRAGDGWVDDCQLTRDGHLTWRTSWRSAADAAEFADAAARGWSEVAVACDGATCIATWDETDGP
jgi:hypothetical protein